jgi:hypothetical protein
MARAIDLAVGDRTGGPVFLAADGRPAAAWTDTLPILWV